MLDSFFTQFTPEMTKLLALSTFQTIYMSFVATFVAVLVGLPLGFWAFLTQKGQILENKLANQILDVIINIGRSIPFIILLIILLPITRLIVGTSIGTTAAIVPLAISAIPFFACLTANALLEIPSGLTEAGKAMGANNMQIISKFYLAESLPSLINATTLTLVSLIGYSAMAGIVGGDGLGSLAINYGEYRAMGWVKWISTIVIVIIVMACQKCGDVLAEKVNHR